VHSKENRPDINIPMHAHVYTCIYVRVYIHIYIYIYIYTHTYKIARVDPPRNAGSRGRMEERRRCREGKGGRRGEERRAEGRGVGGRARGGGNIRANRTTR